MLKSLHIENIAVIERADISFSAGLNVLTGETGAGKSIVVDSINAVLGERTSRELVRHGAQAAVVSAVFEDVNSDVRQALEEQLLPVEEDGTLLITRKISTAGKNDVRVNGVRCTVSQLKALGERLVNIHGQHDSQALLDAERHYQYIDMLGGDNPVYEEYRKAFQSLRQYRRALKQLTADADDRDRRLEQLNAEIEELTAADIKPGEREQLKARRNLIRNAQSITEALAAIQSVFSGDDENPGISSLVATALQEAQQLSDIDASMQSLYTMLADLADKAESAKDETASRLGAVEFNLGELEEIEARLDMYYRFGNRYGATEEEMLSYLDNAVLQRNAIVNSDDELEKLSALYDEAYDRTVAAADALSAYRREVAAKLETDVKEQLTALDMPKVTFLVQFTKGNLSPLGYDKIEFLISTNPGEPPKPLAKIASGGELSRIMLAIKNIIAKDDRIQTLIFDEIDTGVSGRASRKIGFKLKSVAAHTQVLCVTHSAQIASLADSHLLISKRFEGERTFTAVQSLDFEERKQELARIMGGMQVTDTLLKSAEELLRGN